MDAPRLMLAAPGRPQPGSPSQPPRRSGASSGRGQRGPSRNGECCAEWKRRGSFNSLNPRYFPGFHQLLDCRAAARARRGSRAFRRGPEAGSGAFLPSWFPMGGMVAGRGQVLKWRRRHAPVGRSARRRGSPCCLRAFGALRSLLARTKRSQDASAPRRPGRAPGVRRHPRSLRKGLRNIFNSLMFYDRQSSRRSDGRRRGRVDRWPKTGHGNP